MLDLLNTVNYNKQTDTLVFLGDYIDRGKHNYEVITYLINLQKEVGADKCVCLMGNHEYMAISEDIYISYIWKSNGGNTTIKSYHKHNKHIGDHRWWLKKLPLIYETPEIVFCHAGLPKSKINENSRDDILWDREWLTTTTPNEKQVVFGHTPSMKDAYVTKNNNICIDTGCVYGNKLCALIITEQGSEFIYQKKSEKD